MQAPVLILFTRRLSPALSFFYQAPQLGMHVVSNQYYVCVCAPCKDKQPVPR